MQQLLEKPENLEEITTETVQTTVQKSVKEDKQIYDTIIVGGAGAALTAAIYAARRAMKTLVIMKSLGGQAAMTDQIENYPGFLNVGGIPLMQRFLKQTTKSGAEVLTGLEVKEIREEKGSDGKPEFVVKADSSEYKTKTVILSFGKTPRNLGVPGEDKFGNKGVSYCATCDLPLFANKTVAVVGGGNSALDAATYAAKICKKVYLIHRRDDFRGFEYLIERTKSDPKIEILYSNVVKEIKGEIKVHSIVVQDLKTNQTREIPLDGVFVEVGSIAKTDFIKSLVKLDNVGQVIISRNCETFYPDKDEIRPGLFAAGDLTTTPFKQIVVSAGEGCIAALQAYNYLHELKPTFVADWVAKKHVKK